MCKKILFVNKKIESLLAEASLLENIDRKATRSTLLRGDFRYQIYKNQNEGNSITESELVAYTIDLKSAQRIARLLTVITGNSFLVFEIEKIYSYRN